MRITLRTESTKEFEFAESFESSKLVKAEAELVELVECTEAELIEFVECAEAELVDRVECAEAELVERVEYAEAELVGVDAPFTESFSSKSLVSSESLDSSSESNVLPDKIFSSEIAFLRNG